MKVLRVLLYVIIVVVTVFFLWNPMFYDVHPLLPDSVPSHLIPNNLNAIDLTFGVCVYILIEISKLVGVSYNEANIWIFVVAFPFLLLLLSLYVVTLKIKIKKLRSLL